MDTWARHGQMHKYIILECQRSHLSPFIQHVLEIQCWIPEAPRRGYISGGAYLNNKLTFFYSDQAIASCAMGYILSGNRMSDSAYCNLNGEWSKVLSENICVGWCIKVSLAMFLLWRLNVCFSAVICREPPLVLGSYRFWSGRLRYDTTVTYKCYPGYFFQPGLIAITTRCSEDATWQPTLKFKCTGWFCSSIAFLLK